MQQTINETYTLQIPDSFRILSAEELREMNRDAGDPFQWGARDAENHVVLVALWKQYPALLARMMDLKSVVRKNEQLTASAHAECGYRLLEFFSMQAGDAKAEGYRFAYEREGITQVSNNLLIKDGKTIYAFLCIGREEHMDADREMFRQAVETLGRKHA